MSFTEANILEVFALFCQSKEQIMQDSIVSVFDVLSAYDEKNKIHIEGWKTNDAWRVNKKVIIPYCIKFDSNWGGKFDFDSWGKRASMFSDLDKVLCYISGLEFDPNNSITTQLSRSMKAINDGEVSSSDPIITRFCKIKIYKKGTAHLEFTDLELLKEFNRRAAIGKKWLADESSATPKPNHKLKKLNQAA